MQAPRCHLRIGPDGAGGAAEGRRAAGAPKKSTAVNGFMYGTFQVPFVLNCGDTTLEVVKGDGVFHYVRQSPEERFSLDILGVPEILIQPTEPLQTPKPVATALMLAFEKELMLPPKAEETLFLTFPVEIGVFTQSRNTTELIDVFSLVPSKFTLYGKPAGGHICKHWRTPSFKQAPDPEPFRTGVVRLQLKNTSDKWINIDQIVIDAYDMKIFFQGDFCSIAARMKILGQRVAQIECESTPLKKGMTKSIEIFEKGKMNVISRKFLMEEGL